MAYNFYKNRKQQQAKQDSILDDNEKQDSKMQDLSPPKSTAIGFNNHFQQPPSVQQRRGGGFGELAESSSSSSNAVGKGGIPQQRGNNNPFGYGSPRPNIVVNKPAAQSQFSFGLSAGGNNNNMGLLGGQRDGDGLGQEPIGDQSSLFNLRDKVILNYVFKIFLICKAIIHCCNCLNRNLMNIRKMPVLLLLIMHYFNLMNHLLQIGLLDHVHCYLHKFHC